MNVINFYCPHCQNKFTTKKNLNSLGKKAKCKKCGKVFLLKQQTANTQTPTQQSHKQPNPVSDATLSPSQLFQQEQGQIEKLMVVEQPDDVGKNFGRYQIKKELGQGGMGKVYQAYDPQLERMVALKVLLGSTGKDADKRFLREAKATASLNHPNIVMIYDIGNEMGKSFFTMEYIPGNSLKEFLKEQKSDLTKLVDIAIKISKAVACAHEQKIIHRDLKPSNVMMAKDNEPKVMDFGLAKLLQKSDQLSKDGMVMGTLQYMPPEQAEGEIKNIDEVSDVYSLGATIYEMIVDEPPFHGETMMKLIYKILHKKPKNPTKINKDIPYELSYICLKALEKKKRNRYQSVTALVADLERFSRGKLVIKEKGKKSKKLIGLVIFILLAFGMSLLAMPKKKESPNKKEFANKNTSQSAPKKASQKEAEAENVYGFLSKDQKGKNVIQKWERLKDFLDKYQQTKLAKKIQANLIEQTKKEVKNLGIQLQNLIDQKDVDSRPKNYYLLQNKIFLDWAMQKKFSLKIAITKLKKLNVSRKQLKKDGTFEKEALVYRLKLGRVLENPLLSWQQLQKFPKKYLQTKTGREVAQAMESSKAQIRADFKTILTKLKMAEEKKTPIPATLVIKILFFAKNEAIIDNMGDSSIVASWKKANKLYKKIKETTKKEKDSKFQKLHQEIMSFSIEKLPESITKRKFLFVQEKLRNFQKKLKDFPQKSSSLAKKVSLKLQEIDKIKSLLSDGLYKNLLGKKKTRKKISFSMGRKYLRGEVVKVANNKFKIKDYQGTFTIKFHHIKTKNLDSIFKPNSGKTLYYIGLLSFFEGNDKNAKKVLQKALRLGYQRAAKLLQRVQAEHLENYIELVSKGPTELVKGAQGTLKLIVRNKKKFKINVTLEIKFGSKIEKTKISLKEQEQKSFFYKFAARESGKRTYPITLEIGQRKLTKPWKIRIKSFMHGVAASIWLKCSFSHQEKTIIDMGSKFWRGLSFENQKKYAEEYQKGYAKSIGKKVKKIFKVKNTEIEMVLIPPGRFLMGSSLHQVVIPKAFWIGKFEITQAQWKAVAGSEPWKRKDAKFIQEDPLCAASYMNFEQIKDFLSVVGKNFALPKETEWEYACRSGTSTAYYWGSNGLYGEKYAWCHENARSIAGHRRMHKVGKKLANNWGLHDMMGNASEFCWNFTLNSMRIDAEQITSTNKKGVKIIARGGSWEIAKAELLATYYLAHPIARKTSFIFSHGIRIMRFVD